MFYGIIIGVGLNKPLAETELDAFIGDLNSFKKYAVVRGKLRGMPNYAFNLYDETEYDEIGNVFNGGLRVYVETDKRDSFPIDDLAAICSHYGAVVNQLVRKWLL